MTKQQKEDNLKEYWRLYDTDADFRYIADNWQYLSWWKKIRIYLSVKYHADTAPFWCLLRWIVYNFSVEAFHSLKVSSFKSPCVIRGTCVYCIYDCRNYGQNKGEVMEEVKKRKRAPGAGRPPKGEVPMSEQFTFRVTALDTDTIQFVGGQSNAGSATAFWRDVVLNTASGIKALQSGTMDGEAFKKIYGEQVYKAVVGSNSWDNVKQDADKT